MHANPANQIPLIRYLFADSRKQKSIIELFILELIYNFAYFSFVCCLNSINYTQLFFYLFIIRWQYRICIVDTLIYLDYSLADILIAWGDALPYRLLDIFNTEVAEIFLKTILLQIWVNIATPLILFSETDYRVSSLIVQGFRLNSKILKQLS